MARVGPAIDTGFPVKGTHSGSGAVNASVSTPATGGSNRLVIATIAWIGNSGANQSPYSISGMGLSWTRIDARETANVGVETWAAWASSSVGASSVTASNNGSTSGGGCMLCVSAFSGTKDGSSLVSNAIGAINGYVNTGVTNTQLSTTLTGVLGTSGIVTIMMDGQNANALTPLSNVTFDQTDYDSLVVWGSAEGYLNIASSGSVTVGCTFANFAPRSISALEILTQTAPTFTSISPNNGPANGGASVTINGTNFIATPTVTFGGADATNVTWVNSTQITCTTPAHAAGAVSIVITNPDLQSVTAVGAYTYNPNPTVTSVSPASGPLIGGTAVNISGADFVATPNVTFGGVTAINVTWVSSVLLTCATPQHIEGYVTVVVTNPDAGQGSLVNGFDYDAARAMSQEGIWEWQTPRMLYADLIRPPSIVVTVVIPDPAPGRTVLLPNSFMRPYWDPERNTVVGPKGFFVSGPPMEQGWPAYATLDGTDTGSDIVCITPATRGNDRLIYATIVWYSGNTSPGPTNIFGLGLTWTKIASTTTQAPFIEQEGADIYVAWTHGLLDPGYVTVTFTNPGVTYAVLTVYARYDTGGAGNPLAAIGATTVKADVSGSASARNITLTGTAVGSAAVVAVVDGSHAAFTELNNTGFDSLDTVVVTMGSGSLVREAGGGSLTIGMSGNTSYYAIAGAEILNRPFLAKNWEVYAPEKAIVRKWRPVTGVATKFKPRVIVQRPCPTVTLPDSFMRPAWNPDPSYLAITRPQLPAIVPPSPVPPVLVESYLRPYWNPDRSYISKAEVVTHLTPYAITTIWPYGSPPGRVRVNTPFTVVLTIYRPLAGRSYILTVYPETDPEGTIQFGAVTPQGLEAIPTPLAPLGGFPSGAGLLPVTPAQPAVLTWGAVCFKPGEYHISALVALLDGTEVLAQEVLVTAVSVT